jgi:hypothetical protein
MYLAGLYNGAYLGWQSRLISFGGFAVVKNQKTMYRAAAILDFR